MFGLLLPPPSPLAAAAYNWLGERLNTFEGSHFSFRFTVTLWFETILFNKYTHNNWTSNRRRWRIRRLTLEERKWKHGAYRVSERADVFFMQRLIISRHVAYCQTLATCRLFVFVGHIQITRTFLLVVWLERRLRDTFFFPFILPFLFFRFLNKIKGNKCKAIISSSFL